MGQDDRRTLHVGALLLAGAILLHGVSNGLARRYRLFSAGEGVHVYRIDGLTGTVSLCRGIKACVKVKG